MTPFSRFRGTLKRLTLDREGEPARAAAFDWAFPGFLDPLAEQSGPDVTTVSSPRLRRRRYSGGLLAANAPLPRGRYSTVCVNASGDDAWGLCQELRAYAGSTLRQKIFVYDLGESPVQDKFREKGWLVGRRLGLHFDDPDSQLFSRYASIGDAALVGPGFWRTHLDYTLEEADLENVVDLRLPTTQRWFFETFCKGFGSFWRKQHSEHVVRFHDMLPTLVARELGGNLATDAVGMCVRRIGANAFIYPSARCSPETIVVNGQLVGWFGFNLVDFRRLPPEPDVGRTDRAAEFDDPAPWDVPPPWPNLLCEIAELSEYQELARHYSGSWRLRGVREAHEQFWNDGGVLGGHDIGEWEREPVGTGGLFVTELQRRLRDG
jgi:hypothetical protein